MVEGSSKPNQPMSDKYSENPASTNEQDNVELAHLSRTVSRFAPASRGAQTRTLMSLAAGN